jgi:hypothetical protein
MSYSITGRISGVGGGPGDTIGFSLRWDLLPSAPNGHSASEEGEFYVDQTLTDTEMESTLRTLLAERVSTRSGLSFTSADVRGCKL